MDKQSIREHNIRMANFLCKKHGCNEKITQVHFEQIVNRAWNPHPSNEFVTWWQTQPEFKENGVDAIRARNCKVFTDRYKEAVQFGLASLPVDYPVATKATAT